MLEQRQKHLDMMISLSHTVAEHLARMLGGDVRQHDEDHDAALDGLAGGQQQLGQHASEAGRRRQRHGQRRGSLAAPQRATAKRDRRNELHEWLGALGLGSAGAHQSLKGGHWFLG